MNTQPSWFDQNAGWIGFVSAILGVISFGLSILFYVWGRKPKQLGWRVLSKYGMIRGRRALPKLSVSYGGQELFNPVATLVRIENYGKVEIRKEDWEIPVEFNYDESRIVQAAIVDKSDGNIGATINEHNLSDAKCTLQPMLLNQGEWFDVQIITDGPVEEPAINARIAGVTGKLADMEERKQKFQRWMFLAIVAGVALLAVASVSLFGLDAIPVFTAVFALVITLVVDKFLVGKPKNK
ncbi:hypothetical protein [Arthrobacter sp. NicSoilC5]|uniref:hypothetical protein n=1 Tax=Arthrobacter sp. NicSoilC5 TaxID=2831000 RepID=UPI001CC55568|nr:hypothetical protein [Arthrobacter sp. NicSoilC5]